MMYVMKQLLLLAFPLCWFVGVNAQTLPVPNGKIPPGLADLYRAKKSSVDADPVLAESILDLVQVSTTDSTYKRRTERHQFVGAALFRVVGVRWKTVRNTREKIVGTVSGTGISGRERFTEYDVNFNLVPHLMRSRKVIYAGYAEREPMFKARKQVTPGQAPYVLPTDYQSENELNRYDIHVECTPLRDLRPALDEKFYPVLHNIPLSQHPNFEQDNPAMGVYGPLILDCNHTCHPEIHPYEWIWWRSAPEEAGAESSWKIGFLRDASNRFKHWSSKPRTGQMSLPLAFSDDRDTVFLRFENGPMDAFDTTRMAALNLPPNTWTLNQPRQEFTLELQEKTVTLVVTSQPTLPADGLQFWFSNLVREPEADLITGRLHLAAGVANVFTTTLYVEP